MKKDFVTILKEKGLKATKARLLILNIFSDGCQPMTAEEISAKLIREKIDLATVYRSLKSFEEGEIVERVNLQKDSVYYELSNHHHHHLICKKCGLVEELKECNISAKSSNFKEISSHSVEFFGVCKRCSV